MNHRPLLTWTALAFMVACGPKPSSAPTTKVEAAPFSGQLTLLHTNDIHAHFQPNRADWVPSKPDIGGFNALQAYASNVREDRGEENVLLVDGGDLLSGTPLTEFETRGVLGGAMLDFMEAADYTAWVVGNHEFDKGFENTKRMIEESRVPVLSANLDAPGGGPASTNLLDHLVIRAGGLNVGIIGVTTERLAGLASEETMAQLSVRPVVETVAHEVATLDPATDVLIVLSHIGLPADRALAQQVNGIDLIVGGHSHSRMADPERVNGVWIVQAGSYLRSVGQVEMRVENDAIQDFSAEIVDLSDPTLAATASDHMKELVSSWQSEVDSIYGERIGTAATPFTRDYNHDSSLGNWITDALRKWADTDVALYNGGGLRANINEGELQVLDLYKVFPFGNPVVTFEVSGEALMGLALRNAWAEFAERQGFIQVSGMHAEWRVRRGAPEMVDVTIGGLPIELDRTYTVATNSFVADQAARYLGFTVDTYEATGAKILDIAVQSARGKHITAPEDERSIMIQQ